MADTQIKSKRKILSFQPFSIYGNGGGPRIMRRLVEGREDEVVFFSFAFEYPEKGVNPNEVPYVLFPRHRDWMRSFVRSFFIYLRNKVFLNYNIRKARAIVEKMEFDVLHILDHSFYSNILLPIAKSRKIPVWASFHDHFNSTDSNSEVTREVWQNANKRLVISYEMGEHYSALFGRQDYTIVTDGLKPTEIFPAKKISKESLTVFFGGLVHFDYYILFEKFIKALENKYAHDSIPVTVILRGTQKLPFLNGSKLNIEYRPFSMDNKVLTDEMNKSDILYLPIKYSDPDFYKYSFSTKMIGYLGAAGNIFYHGPKESAAARFLERNKCGVICDSLDEVEIEKEIIQVLSTDSYSIQSKAIAESEFNMKMMQDRFFE